MKVRKQPNRLRVLRAEHAVTQMDLAIAAKVAQSRYWRIENGYDQPTDDERRRLARALGVDAEALGFPACEAKAS